MNNFTQKNNKKRLIYKIFLWLFSLFLFGGIFYGGFFLYKTYTTGKKISIENDQHSSLFETLSSMTIPELSRLKKNSDGRINILLLGIAGKGKPGQNLTDTIMLASIDTQNNRVSLLSIPRDLYVNIPATQMQAKINSVYQFGISNSQNDTSKSADAIKKTVSTITGLPIDYYVIMNFDGFEKIINDIGGINITSERDLYDARYPGPNYSYETFELSKGFHHLDGAVALKYARERHNDPEGDFGRAKRQQQIMQAVKNKIFSAGTIFDVFALNNLFDTLGDNVKTDIQIEDFPAFFELARKLDTNNINNVVIDAWNKDSLLKVSHIQYGDVAAFVLLPRVGNYSEIQELAKNIFDLNAIKRRKEEISEENASIAIANQSGDQKIVDKIKKVLQENLDYKNVSVLYDKNKILSDKTIVYDLTNGQKPFTLDELATKLPAAVSYNDPRELSYLPKSTPDLILVIGKDLIERYNGDEGTIEDLNKANDDQEAKEFNILNNQ